MAELCKECFIKTWNPCAYDLEHIVMSENNDFCEGCMDCVPDVDAGELYNEEPSLILIPTLEGVMEARIYDYIIKGINGEFYPCKPEIFAKTYELAEE